MAEGKKSFIAYSDWKAIFDELPDKEAGILIKHIFAYVNDENPKSESLLIRAVFAPIKSTLKRDLNNWSKIRDKRSKAGKISANKRKHNSTHVNTSEQMSTVNVNDNVSVSVNDTVNVNDKTYTTSVKKPKKTFSPDVISCVKNCLKYFDEHLQPKTAKEKNLWCDTVDKLNRIDGIPFEEIERIVKATREDDFWAKNFLSLNKLRRKNDDDIKYIVVFNERLKNKNGQTKSSTEFAIEFAKKRAEERNRTNA